MGAKLIKFKFKPQENEQIEAKIKIPHEPRSVIHGVVKNYKDEFVENAVVKLFEIIKHPSNLKPLSHTFTDEFGQFIFGPLTPEKNYLIKIWFDDIKIRYIYVNCNDDCECKCSEESSINFSEETK